MEWEFFSGILKGSQNIEQILACVKVENIIRLQMACEKREETMTGQYNQSVIKSQQMNLCCYMLSS